MIIKISNEKKTIYTSWILNGKKSNECWNSNNEPFKKTILLLN